LQARRSKCDERTVAWLLQGDPAIRFWTRSLLLQQSPRAVARERARIAQEGWGRRLLDLRAPSGIWGGGLYLPKWTSTHYSLMALKDLGLAPGHAQARQSVLLLLDRGFLPDGGIGFWHSRRSDDCVAAMVLSLLAYFAIDDQRVDRLIDNLLAAELAKGGWNCRARFDPHCASVHTTLSVLEAFDELGRARWRHRRDEVARASARGREALLARRLFLSRTTGRPFDLKMTAFAFPPRWRFDVLRCLHAFARAGVPWDPRMRDALALISAKRCADGRWKASPSHPGRTPFVFEKAGEPGRWNTLRAAFVLGTYGARL
jgi:hypothetical protein